MKASILAAEFVMDVGTLDQHALHIRHILLHSMSLIPDYDMIAATPG
jgi:hypothetical protein